MNYKIGDVSRMLRLSDQMIRYYEKCGVLQPERSENGKYRSYTDMDIFALFDAMRYKEWGIPIAKIGGIVAEDYFDQMSELLRAYEDQLDEEVKYKSLSLQRVREVRDRLRISQYNTGNVWADLMPACTFYYLGRSSSDEYDAGQLDDRMAELIYSGRYITFFDPYVEYQEQDGEWWYMIQQIYHDQLNLPDYGKIRKEPEHLVLKTVIDMGEKGQFSTEKCKVLLDYAEAHHYETDGSIHGMIIGRGTQNGQYRRMMELWTPIRSL